MTLVDYIFIVVMVIIMAAVIEEIAKSISKLAKNIKEAATSISTALGALKSLEPMAKAIASNGSSYTPHRTIAAVIKQIAEFESNEPKDRNQFALYSLSDSLDNALAIAGQHSDRLAIIRLQIRVFTLLGRNEKAAAYRSMLELMLGNDTAEQAQA